MQTGDTNFIYKNELDKSCFQHDMAYCKIKDVVKRTQSDKVLRDLKSFKKEVQSGGFDQNVLIFGVDMSFSAHIDNKKKDILVLGKGPIQVLEHTLTAEKMYSINFTEKNKKICLSLQYNRANSYMFVNGTEIYKFRAKDSEIVASPLCLGNISKDWSIDNMKKTGFNGYVYDFSVDYDSAVVDHIKDIHKYLMKKNDIV